MCHLGFPKFWFGFRRNSLLEQMLFGILPFDVYSRRLGKLISSTVHKSFDPFILVGGRLNNARGSKNQSYNLLQALMFGWRRSRSRNWTETEINPGFENENSGGDRNLNRFEVFRSETTFAETNLSGFDLFMPGDFVALKGAAPIATYIFYAIQIKQKFPAL